MCDAILGYTARLRAAWAIQLAWSNESRATKRMHKEDRKEGGSKGGAKGQTACDFSSWHQKLGREHPG